MSTRTLLIAGGLLFAAMLALTAWAWVRIPDTAVIATHWDIHGRVNGHMGKAAGLLIGPALMAVLLAVFGFIRRIEPRRNNLARSGNAFGAGLIGGLAIAALAQLVIVLTALGEHLPVIGLTMPAVAVLLIVLGNFLGKTRSNFFVGVRTPWTLESDYSWEKTNRTTGRLLVASGFATLAALPIFGQAVATVVMIATIAASTLAGIVLSYFYWRHDPDRHGHDSVPE